MVKRIVVPEIPEADLPFYLSVEEWCAQNLPAGEYFFAWQVEPTIICGRHQDIAAEVDLPRAEKEGVKVWRRKSGGGAVLADMNNVMFSYITPSANVQTRFEAYTSLICDMLKSLGIDAAPTGRNDIAINGKKVAGNAFLKLPGRSIVHGTMLYDADCERMQRLLTPSRAKRQSKGVVSVPSRVTTLRQEGLKLSCEEFMNRAINFICPESNGTVRLSSDDIKEIFEIRKTYLNPLSHKNSLEKPRLSTKHTYLDGAGEMYLDYTLDDSGTISGAYLKGDFLQLKDVDTYITSKLSGCKFNKESFRKRLADTDISEIISGINSDTFLETIFTE